MEFIIKNEYNNGDQDIMEIYHPTNKIKEVWTDTYTEEVVKINEETGEEYTEEETKTNTETMFWNTSEENPLVIAKSRVADYSVSDEVIDEPSLEINVENE